MGDNEFIIEEVDVDMKNTKLTQMERCLMCKHCKVEPEFPYFSRKHGDYGCELQDYLQVSKVIHCPNKNKLE